MESCGFDCVIVNPAFSLDIDASQKEYSRNKFKTLHFKINLFACFAERAIDLTREGGYVSYIVPNLLFANDSLSKLREKFASQTSIETLVNCGDGVFEKVSMPTMIYVLRNGKPKNHVVSVFPLAGVSLDLTHKVSLEQRRILNAHNFVFETADTDVTAILDRFRSFKVVQDVL